MPDTKLKCSQCGAEILVATARRTGGLCMPCKQGKTTPSLSAEELLAELNEAASSLQSRAKILGVRTRQIPIDEWQVLEASYRDKIPSWFQSLLGRYALHGLALEYRDKTSRGVRIFSFQSPDEFKSLLPLGPIYAGLLENGYIPIGYEQNGDLWVMKSNAAMDDAVFLFEQGAWGGGALRTGNGLVFAASRLALLIASMGISELSYDNGVKRLIWFPDGP